MEICQKNEFREEALPTKFGFVNLAACLVLMVAAGVLQTSTYRNVVDAVGAGGGLLSILVPVLLYALFLRGGDSLRDSASLPDEAGYAIYRKCVKRSFVNYEINACGAIVRKEVY